MKLSGKKVEEFYKIWTSVWRRERKLKNFIRYEPGLEEEKFGIFFILGEIDILVDRFCTKRQ